MAADEKAESLDIITVGKRDDDSKAVWDRDPLHPANYEQSAGEVFISDMRPYEVHRSNGIQQKLGEKVLQELRERDADARLDAYDDAQDEKAQRREQLMDSAARVGSRGSVVPDLSEGEPFDTSDEREFVPEDAATATATATTPAVRRPSRGGSRAKAADTTGSGSTD